MLDAYIISLNTPDKLIDKIKSFNLNPILIKGVNGKKLSNDEIKDNTKNKNCAFFCPKGLIGCAMAHIKAWNTFLKSNKKLCVIFEDDAVFKKQFYNNFNNILQNLPEDLDMLYLGCIGCNNNYPLIYNLYTTFKNPKKKKLIKISKYLNKPHFVTGLHAYVLTRKGAEKLVKYLNKNISDHIDVMIYELYLDNKINIYSLNRRIVYQTSTDLCNSLNSSNYPYLLNLFFSKFEVDEMVRFNYMASFSLFRIYNFNFSFNTILLFTLGFILAILKLNIKYITLFFILISSFEILNLKNIDVLLFNYIIFIFPYLLLKVFRYI